MAGMPLHLPAYKKLSILVAAYNEEASLEPCVEAVLDAQLPGGIDREIIIVDDR